MKRSTNGHAIAASKKKQIALANQFFDEGRDLSDISSELNQRGFRQSNGAKFYWQAVSDLIHENNFEV